MLSSPVLAKQEPYKLKSHSDALTKPEGQIWSLLISSLQPTVALPLLVPVNTVTDGNNFLSEQPDERQPCRTQDYHIQWEQTTGLENLLEQRLLPALLAISDAPGRHCWPQAQPPDKQGKELSFSQVSFKQWSQRQATSQLTVQNPKYKPRYHFLR